MSIVAVLRADSLDFPLFLHVLGAMILVGGLVAGAGQRPPVPRRLRPGRLLPAHPRRLQPEHGGNGTHLRAILSQMSIDQKFLTGTWGSTWRW